MKDLSFFLLKNILGSKMRKGFKSFCNGDESTSTLNQEKPDHHRYSTTESHAESPCYLGNAAATPKGSQPTLEEMIFQLELEEKAARRAKLDEYGEIHQRMSCVNSSDILRSARNALNQYPRFSLDGKDAMYRSSFRNLPPIGRKSMYSNGDPRKSVGFDPGVEKTRRLPLTVGGECVVWCKPGVVGKLMGLDAMPIPVNRSFTSSKEKLSSMIKKQSLRRRAERHEMEMERRRAVLERNGYSGRSSKRGTVASCSSTTGYCVMKPVAVELSNDEPGWPMRRYV